MPWRRPVLLNTALRYLLLLLLPAATWAGAASGPAAQTPTCTPRVPLSGAVTDQAVNFAWQPLSPAVQAQLPAARPHPAPLTGSLFWPQDTRRGPFPAVVLLHGSGGTQCDLFSAAQLLAARGYVTLSVTQPDNRSASSETSGVQALSSALTYLDSPGNPARSWTRPDDAALIGHSEGAGVVSFAQGLPGFGAVRAIVALDNLRHWLTGDPGSAVRSCARPPAGPVTPRVPALGLAKDGPCTASGDTDPSVKLSGWSAWVARGVPAAELVPAGYKHLTFTDRGGRPEQLAEQVDVMGGWLDRWLKEDAEALGVLSCQGRSGLVGKLSGRYRSARSLPGLPRTDDLRATLQRCP